MHPHHVIVAYIPLQLQPVKIIFRWSYTALAVYSQSILQRTTVTQIKIPHFPMYETKAFSLLSFSGSGVCRVVCDTAGVRAQLQVDEPIDAPVGAP